MVIYPIRWKIHTSTVAAEFDLFFDHLLAIDLEFHLSLAYDGCGVFIAVFYFFFICHLKLPFSTRYVVEIYRCSFGDSGSVHPGEDSCREMEPLDFSIYKAPMGIPSDSQFNYILATK